MKISIMLFVVFTLCVLTQGQEDPVGYISIDCGAQSDYFDDDLQLNFQTDAGFIDKDIGEIKQVSTEVIDQDKYKGSKNLRMFPNGTRNCYTLRPKQGKESTYLVRAIFWYGNYDNKSDPPVFDLYIDTNHWSTVVQTSYKYEEVIYVARRDYIQVCLVNIGYGVPFISTLELRPFFHSKYEMPPAGALHRFVRYNLGSYKTFRYPEDVYDRLWRREYDGNKSVTNSTPIADTTTSDNAYKVPEEVLMTAEETSSISESFEWNGTLRSADAWYAYFHFAEVKDLADQEVREMDVYVGTEEGDYRLVDTVSLRNQNPKTLVGTMTAAGQKIQIKLEATQQSTLPPLLNALEIFTVINLPNPQTDEDDFYSINNTKTTYGIVEESWQGDPCLPENMTWKGVTCSYHNNDPPRIISLNLSSSNLSGTISTSFSNLTAMISLDLSNNGLAGSLPAFFAQMSNLKFLNLSGNHLNGSIPEQLKKRERDGTIQLSLEDNPLCQMESCQPISPHKKKEIIVPVAVSIASVSALIILGIVVTLWKLDKIALAFARSSTKSKLKAKNRAFTHTEVSQITNNFGTIIGEGGFGKVYLGTLDDNIRVAVKMLSLTSKQGYKEFEAEAQLLMVVHHKNLVSLVGYCDDTRNIALIYEYMPGGNLMEHLSAKNPNALSWIQRLQIAVDAAEGLNYLHHGCKPPIIHRDLKPSNILLNEYMQAKIADFGLSKAFGTENKSYISTRPAGTPGYLDPEFQSSGNLNRKSDVYSFGIILFELITGRSAILRGPKGNTHILHLVTPFIQRGDIQSIMDPRLKGQFSINSAWKAVETAMSCVAETAIQRPDINLILQELKECFDVVTSKSQKSSMMAILEVEYNSSPSPR